MNNPCAQVRCEITAFSDLNPFIDAVTKEITEKCQEVLNEELRG